jgi:hypothetical protein
VTLEPCRVVVLVPQSRGDARAFLRRGRARSRETCGGSGALSCPVMGSVPQGTWRHRSPLLAGGVLCATGHVAEKEPYNLNTSLKRDWKVTRLRSLMT